MTTALGRMLTSGRRAALKSFPYSLRFSAGFPTKSRPLFLTPFVYSEISRLVPACPRPFARAFSVIGHRDINATRIYMRLTSQDVTREVGEIQF